LKFLNCIFAILCVALSANPVLATAHQKTDKISEIISSGVTQLVEANDPRDGRYDQGIELLKKALILQPESSLAAQSLAIAHFNRARDYYDLGLLEESLQNFNAALNYNPNYAEAYYARGVIKNKLGSPHKKTFIDDINKAIELNKNSPNTYKIKISLRQFLLTNKINIKTANITKIESSIKIISQIPKEKYSGKFNIEEFRDGYVVLENDDFILISSKISTDYCKDPKNEPYWSTYDIVIKAAPSQELFSGDSDKSSIRDIILPVMRQVCPKVEGGYAIFVHVSGYVIDRRGKKIIADQAGLQSKDFRWGGSDGWFGSFPLMRINVWTRNHGRDVRSIDIFSDYEYSPGNYVNSLQGLANLWHKEIAVESLAAQIKQDLFDARKTSNDSFAELDADLAVLMRLMHRGKFSAIQSAIEDIYYKSPESLMFRLFGETANNLALAAMKMSTYSGLSAMYIMVRSDTIGLCGEPATTFDVTTQTVTSYVNGFGVEVGSKQYGERRHSRSFTVPARFSAIVDAASLTDVNWHYAAGLRKFIIRAGGCDSTVLKQLEKNMLNYFYKRG